MFFVLHLNVFHVHSHHCHGHSHDDDPLVVDVISSPQQDQRSHRKKNINVQAAVIHVIGDFVQSIGVLCAAILIKIKVDHHFNRISTNQWCSSSQNTNWPIRSVHLSFRFSF